LKDLRKKILDPEHTFEETPIWIHGTVSFVEQQAWIQNKTIR
jgi:ABC-type bacteriocin/lantibiotic exporter with double-glycine peptidase domain